MVPAPHTRPGAGGGVQTLRGPPPRLKPGAFTSSTASVPGMLRPKDVPETDFLITAEPGPFPAQGFDERTFTLPLMWGPWMREGHYFQNVLIAESF